MSTAALEEIYARHEAQEKALQKKINREAKKDHPQISVWEIYPSPENEKLYNERTMADGDFAGLVDGIKKDGVQAPLLISLERYIVSGHQRRKAAIKAGLEEVPFIVLNISRSDYTEDEWIAILREHNKGREKTLDERIMENMVDINPDEAMRAVVDEQVRRAEPKSQTIYVPDEIKERAEITKQTREFANAIKGILNGVLADYLPVTERAIHYRLLELNIKTSNREGKKAGRLYENDTDSAGALSRMLTRLRLCGEVSWDAIVDETRPVGEWAIYRDAAEFLKQEGEQLYTGFARDLMQSQSAYYEILLEKLTVKGILDKVAMRYTIKTMTMRGNSSIDSRHRLAERFRASGKKRLVLFVLTDCDPAGDSIAESTVHSLRDEFGIPDVKAIRVAMTHQIADEYHIAKSLEEAGKTGLKTKKSSVQAKFEERHGRSDCYELEALDPPVISKLLDDEIRANIDIEAYNHEVAQQAIDVAKIRATRKATLAVIKTTAREQNEEDEDQEDDDVFD